MNSRNRDQSFPHGPSYGSGSSSLLSTVLCRNDTSSPQIQTERPGIGVAHQMESQHALSSPSKGMRTRQMLENLAAENSRLTAEMEVVQSKHADIINRMVTDLVVAKSELVKVKLELARNSIQSSESQQSLQEATQLATELRETNLHLREKDQILREREFELFTLRSQLEQEQRKSVQNSTELQELQSLINQQDNSQKTMETSQLDIERSRVANLQKEVQDLKMATITINTTQSEVESERAKSQQYLQELHHWQNEYNQLQSQIQAGDAKSQHLTKQLTILKAEHQKTIAETRDRMQSLEKFEASHANDMAEARRLATFLKKNCEATTRKVKELEAAASRMQQPSMADTGMNQDYAVQSNRSSDPPGAWQTY